jgi:hypothetical protein
MPIIALSGRKQHGKDTAADIIKDLTDKHTVVVNNKEIFQWTKVQFAKKLKEASSLLLGVPIESWEDENFKNSLMPEEWWYETTRFSPSKEPPTPAVDLASAWNNGVVTPEGERKWDITKELIKPTYRSFLQKLGTDVCRNIHPNFWVNATFSEYEGYLSWIMPDCRFPNEVEAVENRNGIVIRIVDPRKKRPENEHESESALDNHFFKYVVLNDGSIIDLRMKLLDLLTALNVIKW